ncbi:MAG: MarR family winged helix-turn-helix transcriptional regulator [Armatimonadota bacterium]
MTPPKEPNSPRPPRFDSPEQEAYLSLWRTYDRLRQLEDELFGRFELTAQQYNALRLLGAVHPERLPTLVIAGKLISRAPDITRLLDRLEQRELVRRERLPEDRRTVIVGITEQGLGLLEELQGAVRDCHCRQLGHLTAEELHMLTRLLRRARSPHESSESSWR